MRPFRTVFWLFGVFSVAAFAADLKPGLWDTYIYQRSESGRVEKENERAMNSLKTLPPGVSKRMNAMGLDWHNGVIRLRLCLTPELVRALKDADEKEGSLPEGAANCQTLSDTQTPTERKRVLLCEAPLLEFQEFSKLEHSTGLLVSLTSTSWHEDVVDGQTEIRQIDTRSRYVSAFCGRVRALPIELVRKSLR